MQGVASHKKSGRNRSALTTAVNCSSEIPESTSRALVQHHSRPAGGVSRNDEMIAGNLASGNDADRLRRLEAEFSEVAPDVRRRNYVVQFGNAPFNRDQPGTTNTFAASGDEWFAAAAMVKTGASPQNLSTETDCTAYQDAKVPSVGSLAAKIAEETEPKSLEIHELNEFDVLLGRGRTYIDHPGNKQLQLLVDTHRGAYDSASRIDKTDITKSIVKVIQSKGGRFLKSEKGLRGWFEVSDERARSKVSHAMRDSRKKPPGVVDNMPVDNMLTVGGSRGRTNTVGRALEPFHQHLLPNSNGLFEAEIVQSLSPSLANSGDEGGCSKEFFSPNGKVPSNRTP